jgi:hypothetical protein
VARHLLAPRIESAEVIAIESIKDDGQANSLRRRQFGLLQEHLQTIDNVVVDIGASNVENLLALMRPCWRSRRLGLLRDSGRPGAQAAENHPRHPGRSGQAGHPSRQGEYSFQPGRRRYPREGAFDTLLSFLEQGSITKVCLECRLASSAKRTSAARLAQGA